MTAIEERRPGGAWCNPHQCHPSVCFEIHNPRSADVAVGIDWTGSPEVFGPKGLHRLPKGHEPLFPAGLRAERVADMLYLELPLKRFITAEYREIMSYLPRLMLRTWGFDPDQEISWHDDYERNVRVINQRVVNDGANEAPARSNPQTGQREDSVGWRGFRKVGHRLGSLRRERKSS